MHIDNGGAGAVETLNVVTTGAKSKVDLGGDLLNGTTKMVVTGDQDFSFDDIVTGEPAMAALEEVDASGDFTGDLDADLSNGGAVDLSITGGVGDDSVTITNYNKDDVVDLGEGDDTLAISLTEDVTSAASVSNVETLSLYQETDGNDYTVSLNDMTSITDINLWDGTDTVTVTDVGANADTINWTSTVAKNKSTTVDSLSYTLADSTGTEDEITLNFDHVNGTTYAPEQLDKEQTLTVANIAAAGVEIVNLNTSNLGPDDTTDTTNKGGLIVSDVTNLTDMQTLNIDSDTYVELDATTLSTTVATIDASEATAGVALDISAIAHSAYAGSGTASTSVTTGDGNDTLGTINGDVKQTINSGDGKDTLTLGQAAGTDMAAQQNINMGAGDDTVSVTTAVQTTKTNADGSKLNFGDGTDTLEANVDTANDIDLTGFTISNLEKVIMSGSNSPNNLVVNAGDLSGEDVTVSTFGSSLLELQGTTSGDTIDASTFTINGSTGVELTGQGGGDTITGTDGNDIITGGDGDDTLTGGTGNDIFNYTAASEADTTNGIQDFTSGSNQVAFDGSMAAFASAVSGSNLFILNGTSGAATIQTASIAGGISALVNVSSVVTGASSFATTLNGLSISSGSATAGNWFIAFGENAANTKLYVAKAMFADNSGSVTSASVLMTIGIDSTVATAGDVVVY